MITRTIETINQRHNNAFLNDILTILSLLMAVFVLCGFHCAAKHIHSAKTRTAAALEAHAVANARETAALKAEADAKAREAEAEAAAKAAAVALTNAKAQEAAALKAEAVAEARDTNAKAREAAALKAEAAAGARDTNAKAREAAALKAKAAAEARDTNAKAREAEAKAAAKAVSEAKAAADAAKAAAAQEEAANRRTCLLCCEDFPRSSMASCTGSGSDHFTCQACFQQYVESELQTIDANAEISRRRFHEWGGVIPCPCHPKEAGGCDGRFSEQTVARCLDVKQHDEYVAVLRREMRGDEQRKAMGWVHKMAAHLKESAPGIAQEVLERQMRDALPGARQCGKCGVGPVMHLACENLSAHHGQVVGNSKIDNSCKACGWFTANVKAWPMWDGKLKQASSEHEAAKKAVASAAIVLDELASSNQGGFDAELERLRQIEGDHMMAIRLAEGA